MVKLIVTFLILTTVFYQADCFTSYGYLKVEAGPNGEVIKYCEDNGVRHEQNETWINNCVQCSCGESYMSCYGIGYNGGVFHVEDCHMVELDNCCYQFVKDDNTTEICMKKQCPNLD